MNWLVARLSEPSSHAGIALLLQAAGSFLPAYKPVFDLLSGFFASVAVVAPEKPAAPAPKVNIGSSIG